MKTRIASEQSPLATRFLFSGGFLEYAAASVPLAWGRISAKWVCICWPRIFARAKVRVAMLISLAACASCSSPEKEFAQAEREHSEAAFAQFIAQHSKSSLVAQARLRVREIALEEAEEPRAPEGWGACLARLSESGNSAGAQGAIALVEDADWAAARLSQSKTAAEHYLAKWPNGRHTDAAREILDWLKADVADNPMAWCEFWTLHPATRRLTAATARVDATRSPEMWGETYDPIHGPQRMKLMSAGCDVTVDGYYEAGYSRSIERVGEGDRSRMGFGTSFSGRKGLVLSFPLAPDRIASIFIPSEEQMGRWMVLSGVKIGTLRASVLESRERIAWLAGDEEARQKVEAALKQIDPGWRPDPRSRAEIAWLAGAVEKGAQLAAELREVDPTWRLDVDWCESVLGPQERTAFMSGDARRHQKLEVALQDIDPAWMPDMRWRLRILEGRERIAWMTGNNARRDMLESQIKAIDTGWMPKRAGLVKVDLGAGVSLGLISVGPATFTMGSPDDESGRNSNEAAHPVTITKGFWLGVVEVTQKQWRAVMGGNPSEFTGDDLPVRNVSWDDAMDFCKRVTERERAAMRLPEGYEYTLPTEAQWECACRAGTVGAYAGVLDDLAWYDRNCGGQTREVGQKLANGWGLYDMHGSVWEWCRDRYGEYTGGLIKDPRGPVGGAERVIRGGGTDSSAKQCRSALRIGYDPGRRTVGAGFRVALTTDR